MPPAALRIPVPSSFLRPPPLLLAALQLPGRLPVQSTMDGSSLMPLLEGLGVKPGKVRAGGS